MRPAHKAAQVKEADDIELSNPPKTIVGRIKGDGAGVDRGDDEFDTLGAEQPSEDEDVIHVPNNSQPLAPLAFQLQLPTEPDPPEFVKEVFIHTENSLEGNTGNVATNGDARALEEELVAKQV